MNHTYTPPPVYALLLDTLRAVHPSPILAILRLGAICLLFTLLIGIVCVLVAMCSVYMRPDEHTRQQPPYAYIPIPSVPEDRKDRRSPVARLFMAGMTYGSSVHTAPPSGRHSPIHPSAVRPIRSIRRIHRTPRKPKPAPTKHTFAKSMEELEKLV